MSHDIGKSRNSTPRCLRLLPRQTTPHQYVAFLDCGKRGQTYSWCFCPRVYHHTAQYTLIDEPLLSGRIVGYSSICQQRRVKDFKSTSTSFIWT